MRLRQFVFVVRDLPAAVQEMRDVLGLETCYSDPIAGEFGLKNAMFPIGGNFFEIIAPVTGGTTAERFLDRRGGDGGYMMMLQSADALADRKRNLATGVRSIWEYTEPRVIATHFDPRDVPGAILSIDTMHPGTNIHRESGHWEWAGPEYQHYRRDFTSRALAAIELQVKDPDGAAAIWARVTGDPVRTGQSGPELVLDNARIRFVPVSDDRGPGPRSVDVLPQNRSAILNAAEARGQRIDDDTVMLCGVRVNLL